MKQTIAVLFGGCSPAYEISCLSAATVLQNLDKQKYKAVPVGITKRGQWLAFGGLPQAVADGSWAESPACRPAVLSADRSTHGLLLEGPREALRVDCVFPVLHGRNGEDGAAQGLLQLSGIPYVGGAPAASAVCVDKALTHTLLAGWGVPQAHFLWFYAENYSGAGREKIRNKINARLGLPFFLKPAVGCSSIGISKVKTWEDFDDAVALANKYDDKLVAENCIQGREISCAVLGGTHPQASVAGEIVPGGEFRDYNDKYRDGKSQLFVPARLDPCVEAALRRCACRVYRLLGCAGLVQVDFFVQENGELLLNELDPLPELTAASPCPKLWEASGLPLPQLLDQLIAQAQARPAL